MKQGIVHFISFVCVSVLITFAALRANATEVFEFETNGQLLETKMSKMTPEEKVGQLFIFGVSGTQMTPRTKKFFKRYTPGAVIMFKRNIKSPLQIYNFNQQAQMASIANTGFPLLIMVDQEGGVVTRIKTRPTPPSALAIGTTRNTKLAEEAGFITGDLIRTLGFNMNLAPVVDLSDPLTKNFIGSRSFGKSPQLVSAMGTKFSRGLYNAGVIPTLKHFPGHGKIIQDSHKVTPKKLDDLETLASSDLVPFSNFAKTKMPSAVMVAHVAYPNIDPSGLPATYSHKLVTDTLKGQLGYKGLVITDDLEMIGAKTIKGVGARALAAFQAGSDMLMVAWTRKNQRLAFQRILKAVKTGEISEERLNESVKKILSAKQFVGQKVATRPRKNGAFKRHLARKLTNMKEITNAISETNIERSLQSQDGLAESLDDKRLLLVFSADRGFFSMIKESTSNPIRFSHLQPKKPSKTAALLNKYGNALPIYYVTGNGTARRLNNLPHSLKSRIIVVNSTNPGSINQRHQFRAIFDLNSKNYLSGRWIADYLRTGLFPVNEFSRLPANE